MTIIKKYGNRRLYDTDRSAYINLEELAALIRDGAEVKVVDAANGDDLTREIMLQIVLDVLRGRELLPVGFLRRVIRASGDDPAQRMLRQQISTGLDVLAAQMDQIEALFATMPKPGAKPKAEPAAKPAPKATGKAPPPEAADPDAPDAELVALRERLAGLESRLKGRTR